VGTTALFKKTISACYWDKGGNKLYSRNYFGQAVVFLFILVRINQEPGFINQSSGMMMIEHNLKI
jgi:hypothetical protein